jgi:hypothetical protein
MEAGAFTKNAAQLSTSLHGHKYRKVIFIFTVRTPVVSSCITMQHESGGDVYI